MQRIGVWTNAGKDPDLALTRALVAEILQQGAVPVLTHSVAQQLDMAQYAQQHVGKDVICLVVLGGDGTILTAVQQAIPYGVPVLGINLGRLGFLAEREVGDFSQVVRRLLSGEFAIEERTMIACSAQGIEEELALNDVVVARGRRSNLVHVEIRVRAQTVDRFVGDGLVVATPTGSTAYSLSAGGPIVSPALRGIILAPISPHTLHARPIIVPDTDEVEVLAYAGADGEVTVSVDGRPTIEGAREVQVLIRRSVYKAWFVRLSERNFYELLQRKLTDWSGAHDAT